jgi:putative transposase
MKKDVGLACAFTRVSRSGYYRWLQTADKQDPDHEDYLLIKELYDKGRGKYGHRTITMKLVRDKQITMNHKKVLRIMNKYELVAKVRRKNPYKMIMKKTQEHRTCDNILAREFKQLVPLRILCTDITYLWVNHRFAYLSVIKDIASREIVAWSLSWYIDMNLVLETVNGLKQNAESNSWPLENVLLHSDQGFHYTNPNYISEIKKLKIRQSMSRKGNCIDNSPMESFFGHFKDEVDYKDCKTFEELKQMVKEYIDYYNLERQQWELKKMTPVEYRDHLLETH